MLLFLTIVAAILAAGLIVLVMWLVASYFAEIKR
jgi:hypothetical protein